MEIDFEKCGGLVPVIVQDSKTKDVLMLGFMNQEALEKTRQDKKVTFYSRTKNRLWTKGESSGNFLEVQDIKIDCDNDTLLITANPVGPVCHSGSDTCFGDRTGSKNGLSFLEELQKLIVDRKSNPKEKSYTSELFSLGTGKIAQKVGEEAVELVIASLESSRLRIVEEAADLVFHSLVLLQQNGVTLDDVLLELKKRHRPK